MISKGTIRAIQEMDSAIIQKKIEEYSSKEWMSGRDNDLRNALIQALKKELSNRVCCGQSNEPPQDA